MNKTTIKSFVLIALLAMPNFIQAQTFKGISEELKANNTPEGWKKVDLPQLPEITEKNTFNIVDYGATLRLTIIPKLYKRRSMQYLQLEVW